MEESRIIFKKYFSSLKSATGAEGGDREWLQMKDLINNKNVLKLIMVMVEQFCQFTKNHSICTVKIGVF